jgi:hypothetical protein
MQLQSSFRDHNRLTLAPITTRSIQSKPIAMSILQPNVGQLPLSFRLPAKNVNEMSLIPQPVLVLLVLPPVILCPEYLLSTTYHGTLQYTCVFNFILPLFSLSTLHSNTLCLSSSHNPTDQVLGPYETGKKYNFVLAHLRNSADVFYRRNMWRYTESCG